MESMMDIIVHMTRIKGMTVVKVIVVVPFKSLLMIPLKPKSLELFHLALDVPVDFREFIHALLTT